MLDDTLRVARKAEAAGVCVQQTTYPGMFHVFQMLFPKICLKRMKLGRKSPRLSGKSSLQSSEHKG